MRMTKHRAELIDVLKNSPEALSAAELHAHLPHINLVTIYRSLEQFVEQAMVKKLSFGDQEALYEVQDEPHHHAICTDCGTVIHFSFDDGDLATHFDLPGFSVRDVEVTVRGVCKRHQSK